MAEARDQRFYAKVGEKLIVTGNVTACTPVHRKYGTSYVLVVEGVGEFVGVTVRWKASRWPGAQVGDKVTITGAIVAHKMYQRVPQTVVARATVVVH